MTKFDGKHGIRQKLIQIKTSLESGPANMVNGYFFEFEEPSAWPSPASFALVASVLPLSLSWSLNWGSAKIDEIQR